MATIFRQKARVEIEQQKDRSNDCPQVNILINGNKRRQNDQFKYLGT